MLSLKASYCTLELQTAKSKPWPLARLITGSSSGSSSTQPQLDLLNKELQKLEMPIYVSIRLA
ncbi:hypothetical protein FRB90_012410 [Tulasnella sp. 427]|nr:hypothetical protein FRB90_012410 [Tulasnella sp. 427]